MEGNLIGNYLSLIPGLCLELVGKFKMAAGEKVSITLITLTLFSAVSGRGWILNSFLEQFAAVM